MVSRIFPKNDHLKYTMYSNSLLGVWPFIFENNPNLRKLYNIYAKFTFYYFILFILSATLELFIIVLQQRFQEIMANICITVLYIITAMRVSAVRSTDIKNLVKEILATEDSILEKGDEEMIKIYKYYARQSQITNLLFIANISVETIFYFTHPLNVEDQVVFNNATNETTVIKALPLSSWFPYNRHDHYLASYLWQVFDGSIGASYVMFTDSFTFSLIIFPLGQIRILIHVLSNFPKYAVEVRNRFNCSKKEASFITLRECMLRHKEIIRYLQVYNDSMKNIMMLDFVSSSLQLASIVIQLVVTKPTIFNVIFHAEFALCMIIRLTVYYWYANEIVVQSVNVSSAIYESDWYDEPDEIKKIVIFIILRANKALALDIGPFTTMTLASYLTIIKATYSYIMVMYR